jgi:hypothetical protein
LVLGTFAAFSRCFVVRLLTFLQIILRGLVVSLTGRVCDAIFSVNLSSNSKVSREHNLTVVLTCTGEEFLEEARKLQVIQTTSFNLAHRHLKEG